MSLEWVKIAEESHKQESAPRHRQYWTAFLSRYSHLVLSLVDQAQERKSGQRGRDKTCVGLR